MFLECPDGWTYFNGTDSCYKVFTTPLSWTNARNHCLNQDADLASVTNSETNSFLTTLTTEYSWIGGYRSGSDWGQWTDGSNWGYTNWSSDPIDEPDNLGGDQDKLLINWGVGVGKWDDNRDTTLKPFICRLP